MSHQRVLPYLLFAAAAAGAQESIHFAAIAGKVVDPSGSPVAGARITALQLDTRASTIALTDREGRFRFAYLPAGAYEVATRKDGFADQTLRLTVTIGSAFDLPIALSLADAQTTVTVSAESAVLEAARSQIAGTLSPAEIRELPLNGRNFLDAALVIPGVSPTNTGANQLFAESAAVPGQGISIGSQRNFSNSFLVDGLSDNDDASGLTGAFYALDAVEELQVVTSGGQAEFGRALGGFVNVVTRSGGDQLHADLYGYFRNRALNAANALSNTMLPMTEAQYGISLGGPVVRRRTFYFANFEQRELNQSGLATILPANVSAINAQLAAIHYPGAPLSTGIYSNPVHNANFLGKVDHRWNDRDIFSARYSLYRVTSLDSRGAGGLSAPSASANLSNTDHVVAASDVHTFSERAVNELRGEFWNSDLSAPPSDPIGPAVSISGVATFGTLSGSPTARLNRLAEAADNFSYRAGAHALRIGTEFLYNGDTITFPRSFRGSYSFSSLANFLSGTYNSSGFTQTFNNDVVHQTNPNIGWYAQDEWTVSGRLTLNLGVRYDLEYLRTIVTDRNNLAPRGGFAWAPFASRRTVVRGGFGLFYDRVPLRPLANALLSANNTVNPQSLSQISISLSPGQAGAPAFPNVLGALALPSGVLFNFSTMDRRLQNAYSQQGSFEIEQQLGPKATVSAGYQRLRGLHLIASINQNVPSCAAAGTNDGCRPNLAYGNDSQYSSAADSHYDGLHLSFVEHPAKWGNFRVSYTYAKALDDISEFFFSAPINNFNIWQDYSRSDDDQRHRFVFDGSLRVRGFALNGLLQYYSALPFNITTGANTIQGTAARPAINGVFINRNAGSGFDFLNVGARLSRSFQATERLKLTLFAEGFNLTNHMNGVSLNGVFGAGAYPANPSPTFRQITAVNDPRAFQLGLRLAL